MLLYSSIHVSITARCQSSQLLQYENNIAAGCHKHGVRSDKVLVLVDLDTQISQICVDCRTHQQLWQRCPLIVSHMYM